MEVVNCNLCQAQDAREFLSVYDWYWFNGGPFTIVRCCRCGLTYLNPRPSGPELSRFNQSMWERWSISEQSKGHIGSPETARYTYSEILDELNRLKPGKGNLLEIGSGEGGFLKVCQQEGWNTYGIDISHECVAYAKSKHGLDNVLAVDLLDAGFDGDRFDVVIMNHLIEHLADPQSYLEETRRILKPTGILCISTPNIDSLSASIFGRYWQALLVPLHLTLFSPTTLSQMLKKTGYSPVNISHFSRTTNTYIFLRSASCVVGLSLRRLGKLLRRKDELDLPILATRTKESPMKVIFRLLRPVLGFLVAPIVFFEGVIQRGASITVYAVPKKS
jgi:2-polyprenyl-3-methyl-5-hydroxy-6-metoxy-1,4-benzoquinol methylase